MYCFADTSKYAWDCVLMQEKTHTFEEKETKILHPITYMSGLFRGSQINWACFTKEAYVIYMSIKKLTYYLEDADVTLRSDYLPLKKFLAKNTLNSKVNNWAIEISPFRITFEYIKEIKNTLAETSFTQEADSKGIEATLHQIASGFQSAAERYLTLASHISKVPPYGLPQVIAQTPLLL